MKKGDKVILRANMAGVFYGTLEKIEGNTVYLTTARKLYSWSGANAVEQIALEGVKNPDACRFTVWVEEIAINDFCQMLKCTEKASKCIEEVKEWKH
jgi:hypothetical protein